MSKLRSVGLLSAKKLFHMLHFQTPSSATSTSSSFDTMASKRERLENGLEQLECEFDDGMWVPKTSGGKQVSPNSMRTKIRKVR